jgi:hypothetical protein
LSFRDETPLDEVLRYIKQATTTPSFPGIAFYVDPTGLQEVEKSLRSTVHIDLEGVPLRTSLRLVVEQLRLSYSIKDGNVIISSPRIIQQLGESQRTPRQ